jgi:hypothetical protein
MKTIYIFILFLVITLFPKDILRAQDEVVYYYAWIVDNDHKSMYVSGIEAVVFMEYYNYKTDEVLPVNMEEQFKTYVADKYSKFVFSVEDQFSYLMTPNETEIEESSVKLIEKYKSEGYEIKRIKGFYYD